MFIRNQQKSCHVSGLSVDALYWIQKQSPSYKLLSSNEVISVDFDYYLVCDISSQFQTERALGCLRNVDEKAQEAVSLEVAELIKKLNAGNYSAFSV